MFHGGHVSLVLLLASLASGPALAAGTHDLALIALDAHPPVARPLLPCVIVRAEELPAATERMRAELNAPCALGLGDLAAAWSAPAAPFAESDDHAPARADEERFEQLLSEIPDLGTSGLDTGALATIVIGFALFWAAGPLGRLILGVETPSRPRRADDPGSR
jgi:hypothetical protein